MGLFYDVLSVMGDSAYKFFTKLIRCRRYPVVGAVVLIPHGSRWSDNQPSVYIHNLVTAIGEKGTGHTILKFYKKAIYYKSSIAP